MEQQAVTVIDQSEAQCHMCHQPILTTYYFCPNCGAQLQLAPLPVTLQAQLGLYAFSVILPSLCFLFINKWKGIRYVQSKDTATRTIGMIACALLAISTVLTFWYAYTITQKVLQQSMNLVHTEGDVY